LTQINLQNVIHRFLSLGLQALSFSQNFFVELAAELATEIPIVFHTTDYITKKNARMFWHDIVLCKRHDAIEVSRSFCQRKRDSVNFAWSTTVSLSKQLILR